ncbi:unnamed protein product [Vitrella brassicaformis CCMP3155]|uniref:Cyclic nucleotide-binding domain-containing protein n=1 Tax=Vitrella brassicaformis (strain CCMP3155) TaxID=1169540 RepID=A0A0G4ENU4_VITBC|nr:unnamed protein product [Vitrella brassicaformis CCMP3155]|eukprot:CEL99089.1 unnamed protein product [Vitrella brassicaformis CCMP3155]
MKPERDLSGAEASSGSKEEEDDSFDADDDMAKARHESKTSYDRSLSGISRRLWGVSLQEATAEGEDGIEDAIHPASTFRVTWDCVIIVLTLVSVFYTPFSISFLQGEDDLESHGGVPGLYYPEWPELSIAKIFLLVIDVCFCTDLVLNFMTGFEQDGILILSVRETSRYYLRNYFAIDLVASFPFDVIFTILTLAASGDESSSIYHTYSASRAFRMLKLIRLTKLMRIARMARSLQRFSTLASSLVLQVIKYLFVLMLFAHWSACLAFFQTRLADFPDDSWIMQGETVTAAQRDGSSHCSRKVGNPVDPLCRPTSELYSFSLFKALSLMLCIGYGKTGPPRNVDEAWVVIASMLIGASLFAVVIGTVAALLTNMDNTTHMFYSKLEDLKQYMKHLKVPKDLQKQVLEYFYEKNVLSQSEDRILRNLSPALCKRVKLHICAPLIEVSPVLKRADPGFVTSLVPVLERTVFLPGDVIHHQHEISQYIYLISSGVVQLLIPLVDQDCKSLSRRGVLWRDIGSFDWLESDQAVSLLLSAGSIFGDEGLFLDLTGQPFAAVAAEPTVLFAAKREDFQFILRHYPEVEHVMAEISIQRLRLMRKQLQETSYQSDKGGIDSHKRVQVFQELDKATRSKRHSSIIDQERIINWIMGGQQPNSKAGQARRSSALLTSTRQSLSGYSLSQKELRLPPTVDEHE